MKKNLQQTITAIIWGGLCVPVSLVAAEQAPIEQQLEEVVVWGTQVSNSSVYLGEGDIAVKQADHLSDLLRDQPGVDIGGTHSTNQRINLRGLDDTDLKVTIDGANQNTYMYHHAGNLLINADILKEVDVNVGTNSIVHGGLGGSVAFETKDAQDLLQGDDNFGGRVSVSASHNKARGGSVTLFGQSGKVDGLVYSIVNDRDNPKDGAGNETLGNDGKIQDSLVKVGVDVTNNQRIEFSHGQYKDKGDYAPRSDMGVATNSNITSNVVYPTEYDRKTTTLNYELDKGEKLNVKASLSKNELSLDRTELLKFDRAQRKFVPDNTQKSGKATNTRFNITAESNLKRGNTNHQLTYGADMLKQESTAYKNNEKQSEEKATNRAVFVEDRIEFANGVAVTPGVRFDSYKADTATSNKTFDQTSGALAVEVPINKHVTAHASTTQLFKGPELAEVYIDQASSFKINPDIKPETGTNNEIGLKFQKAGFIGADRFTSSIKGFQTDIKDSIQENDAGDMLVNAGQLEIKGLEASARYKKGKLGTTVTYAKSDSKFKNTGEPLDREIGDTVTLGVDYQARKNVALSWSTIKVMDEDNVSTGSDDKPGYVVTNVSANWKPQAVKGLDFSVGVDNLFDKKYTSHASRIGDSNHPVFGALHLNDYEPGRNVKVTASYSF